MDVVAETMHLPLEDQRGGMVEINAAPGLRMHPTPFLRQGPRAVGEAIIANMYADGEDGRIPVVAVAGTNGKTTTVRLAAHLLGQTGTHVGMTNSDGVYIGAQRIDTGDCSGLAQRAPRAGCTRTWTRPCWKTARGGILREGLAFDRCDVAVVTNIGMGDHLGLGYISTVEDPAVAKREIVQYGRSPAATAVLNAADPIVAAEWPQSAPGHR